jgi:hypothetical protein
MRSLLIIFVTIFIFSCDSRHDKSSADSLQQWILNNHKLLEKDIETIIKNDLSNNKRDSNWLSSGIVTTMYAPNSLGTFAKIAGDSTECIVVELTFYKDKRRKRELMLAAEDSSCLNKLNTIKFDTDSVSNLLFGKKSKPLYTKEGEPL